MPCGTANVQAHGDRHVRAVKTMPNFPSTGEGRLGARLGAKARARSTRSRQSTRFLTGSVAELIDSRAEDLTRRMAWIFALTNDEAKPDGA